MAFVMTYPNLVTQISNWLERQGDTALVNEVPYIISLAEDRMARELKVLGVIETVTNNFVVGRSWMSKPVRWRETVSLNYGTGTGNVQRNFIYQRSYEWCRAYWRNPTLTKPPRYYAEWNWDVWLIVPTPDAAYPFELMFYQRENPLDNSNQTNWWTANAPSILHAYVMLEAMLYIKDTARAAFQDQIVDQAVKSQFGENIRQRIDRSQEAKEK